MPDPQETSHTEPVNLHEIPALKEIQVRDGLALRPLAVADGPRMLEMLDADPSIRTRVSVASRLHSQEDVATEVAAYQGDDHLIRYTILENGVPVGLVSFWRDVNNTFDAPDNPDDYGFGYFLDSSNRGRGVVTAAVRSIMDTATKNFYVRQFIAYCEDDNRDSIGVLLAQGFEPTDTVLTETNTGWSERKFVRPVGNSQSALQEE